VSKLTATWRVWVSFSQDIRGKGSSLWNIFLVCRKVGIFLLSDSANCTVLRAVDLTQYRRVTDRQTDGIGIASTELAMRALRRAVTNDWQITACRPRRIFLTIHPAVRSRYGFCTPDVLHRQSIAAVKVFIIICALSRWQITSNDV